MERGNIHKFAKRALHAQPSRLVTMAQRNDPLAVIAVFHDRLSLCSRGQVFLMKRSPHFGQRILIVPFPRGTRTIWRQRGHLK